MKRRWLINLALLAVVIGLGILAALPPQSSKPSQYRISNLRTADISSIQLSRPGQPDLKLLRRGAAWTLAEPQTARADPSLVQRLLDLLQATSSQRFPAADLTRFGLDQPLATLTLNRQSFMFGTENSLAGEIYVASEGQVYLIAPSHLAAVLKIPADFISKRLLAEDEVPVAIDLGYARFTQEQGKWLTQASTHALSQDQINQWVDEWRLASSMLAQPGGTGQSSGEIILRTRNGKSITLSIMQKEPEFVLLRNDENIEYHFPPALAKRLLEPAAPPQSSVGH